MGTNRNREGGFSLLEIIMAVLIVGIMATAVIPMLGDYSSRAATARLMADGEAVVKACERYSFEHRTPIGTVIDPADGSTNIYTDSTEDPELSLYTQLLNPSDRNGNPMNEPAFAGAGPFSYGPYLDHKPRPASLLLGAPAGHTAPGQMTAIHMYFTSQNATAGALGNVVVGRINRAAFLAQNNPNSGNGRATNLCSEWPIRVEARCDQWNNKGSTLYPAHSIVWDSNDARPVIAPVTRGPATEAADFKATDGPFGVRLVYATCTPGVGPVVTGPPTPTPNPIPGCSAARTIVQLAFNPSLRGGVVQPEGPPIDNLDLLEAAVNDICRQGGSNCVANTTGHN